MAWPEEYGGRGASPWEQTAVREEMWAHHEPRGAQYMGVNWVGPAIMRHGTAEQQRQHLPPIAAGEVIWCQGFSEPDAGSDLASLQTAARRDGDGWRISGQKIWTSYATMAQWCFLLARTSRGEKKQQGITVFLVPMDAPGIEVRPDPVHARPPPPQRGLPRRRVGHRGRRARARSTRAGRWCRRSSPSSGSASPATPGSSACCSGRRRPSATRWDAPARRAAQPLGPDAGPRPPGPAARLPGHRHAADRPGAPRRHGRLPHRRDPARPGERRGAHGHRRASSPPDGEAVRRFRRAVEDHHRYAVSATVASGSIEMQRILLARALLAAS